MPTYLTGEIAATLPPMRLKSRATAEYGGACPFCGGDPQRSDRFCVWMKGRPRYWCRQCGRSGPLDDLLNGTTRAAGTPYAAARVSERPRPIAAHIPAYRKLYRAVAAWAQTNLSQPYNPEPLTYLRQRGLHEQTIRNARLGYALDDPRSLLEYLQRQHADLLPYAEEAGVVYRERAGAYETHWNLQGCLVLPYVANGEVVDLRTRTFPGKGYTSLPGGYPQRGAVFPYGWDTITADCVLITEGEFKALAVSQAYEEGTLTVQAVAHPGLSYFSPEWADHLVARGVHVVILGYDSQERPVDANGVTKLAPEEIWSLKHGWTLRRAGLQVMVLRLPLLPGQTKADLDAFIEQYGPGALSTVFQTVVPLTTYHRNMPPALLEQARLPVPGTRRRT